MFSTMTTDESTRMPMAIASPPKDIRLAEIPNCRMMIKEPSTVKGSTVPTVMAERRLPKNNKSTISTRITAWAKAPSTVPTAFSTRVVRS